MCARARVHTRAHTHSVTGAPAHAICATLCIAASWSAPTNTCVGRTWLRGGGSLLAQVPLLLQLAPGVCHASSQPVLWLVTGWLGAGELLSGGRESSGEARTLPEAQPPQPGSLRQRSTGGDRPTAVRPPSTLPRAAAPHDTASLHGEGQRSRLAEGSDDGYRFLAIKYFLIKSCTFSFLDVMLLHTY